MSYIITLANQKGGVGKSTTAHALGQGLLLKEYRVLFVDLDAQGNLSYAMEAPRDGFNVYDVLTRTAKVEEAIRYTLQGDIVPATPALSGADMTLLQIGKEYLLKEALEPLKDSYDFILIDTPPALGILTVNALTASDGVIIPTQADIFSLQGIGQLYNTIQTVRTYCNSRLDIKGILLTRFNNRSILSRDVAEMIRDTAEQLKTKVYTATIREGIAIKEAQATQADIFSYAPKSNVAADYRDFVAEVLEEIEGGLINHGQQKGL